MRSLIPLVAGAILCAAGTAQAGPREDPEAKLARILDGRVAGEPIDCILLRNVRTSRIIDNTAIVYDAGSTIYVNRPDAGLESLDRDDTLVTKLHDDRLCDIDVVQLVDSGSRMHSGTVFLGKFVPYKRVRAKHVD